MEELIKNLSSISWWFGIVFVGIVLNVLSAYLKPALDSSFSKISSRWRNRSEDARTSRALIVSELRNDKHQQLLMLADENRKRLLGINLLIISLMLLLISVSIKIPVSSSLTVAARQPQFWIVELAYWSSLMFMFFSILETKAAQKCKSIVKEAQENN
jgi:hypothetical protein